MKPAQPTELGRGIVRFFEEYLPVRRGLSPHTIHSYRDALVLLLQFAAQDAHRRVEELQIADLSAERVVKFLRSLETDRHNSIATRNARLGAIHAFVRFLAAERPEHLGSLQQVLAVPFRRGGRDKPIEYLESVEIDALLKTIDRSRPAGQRDYALLALMLNTGARVQEVLNLRRRDVRLEPPCQVRLQGKGNKVRLCPIWSTTARLLRDFTASASSTTTEPADALLFNNARGRPLTRFGVRYLLRKHIAAASSEVKTLRGKNIHPHSIRHSTAILLLKAGVDFATISQLLGHASLNTTMRYSRADLDLKRQALAQVFPSALAPPRAGRLLISGTDLLGWLRRM